MRTRTKDIRLIQGLTQLSIVEHALCPLDVRASLQKGLTHRTSYRFTDANGMRRTARVRVDCALGLSSTDEFYLWGLLALAFAQPDPTPDFWATPHYCLRQLGVISPDSKGGKCYRQFRASLGRLAALRYENDSFFDPIRQEHRRVSFGLLGYSLPLDERSRRTWRIVWDAQFFEFCQATGGKLRFDLALYRKLDPASRRLLLLLQKVFYRRRKSPRFRLHELAVKTLGFADGLPPNKLRAKTERAAEPLCDVGILAEPAQFTGSGRQTLVEFRRGPRLDKRRRPPVPVDSPLNDALTSIGLDEAAIRRVRRLYSEESLRLWCDVTLAAIEHKAPGFFSRSAAAYLIDNLKAASRGERTPPDWFFDLRKQELLGSAASAPQRAQRPMQNLSRALSPGLATTDFATELAAQFIAGGQSEGVARSNAARIAKLAAQRQSH